MKFNILEFTLDPGQVERYQMRGRHIRGLSGVGVYTLEIDDESPTEFQTGLAYTFTDFFNKVVITNTTSEIMVIKIGISDGPIDDNRLVGQIDVSGGLATLGAKNTVFASATVTTGILELDSEDINRSHIIIQNLSVNPVYVGSTFVMTVNTGMEIPPGGSITLDVQSPIYLRAASGSNNIRYMIARNA